MKPYHYISLFIVTILIPGHNGFAQSSLNPDISVIPDFRIYTTDQKGSEDRKKINFSLDEVEVAFQSPLNPYSRADVFIGFSNDSEEPMDIEEAYFTILKGLPLNLNIKGGKFLVDFSKLNTLHAHAFPFVDRPLYQQSYFGEEGLKDVGVEVNTLLPTGDVYCKWSATASTGDELDGKRKSLFYTSRLSAFFTLSDYSAFETSFGGATGISDIAGKRYQWINADLKYKWKKDQYTSLTAWAEGLSSQCNSLRTFGFYTACVYQFKRRFEIGSKFDITQSIDNKDRTRQVSVNINFLPVEETLVFRFLASNTKPPKEKSFNTIMVQTIFSLGPHKAHSF
jgi:hypothetical protein